MEDGDGKDNTEPTEETEEDLYVPLGRDRAKLKDKSNEDWVIMMEKLLVISDNGLIIVCIIMLLKKPELMFYEIN